MSLDLSRFKKISSDEKCTVLKNDEGHEIRVAHKALSPELKKQINGIPQHFEEGGEVGAPIEEEIGNREPASSPGPQDAVGGFIAKHLPNFMFEGGKNPYNGEAQAAPVPPSEVAQPVVEAPQATSLAPAAPVAPIAPVSAPAADTTMLMSGLGKEKTGLMQEAKATGELGNQEAQIQAQQIDEAKKIQADYQTKYDGLMGERANIIKDIETQKINPNHFMDSLSTGQRIQSTIGLLLSGFGSGLAHQENMAQKMLQSSIDRDIDAQKNNLGKKQSLLQYNLQQLGNLKDATEMTRATLMGITASKLNQAGSMSKDPLAKARAMQAAGKLEMDAAPLVQKAAERQAAMGLMNSSDGTEAGYAKKLAGLRTVNPDLYKEAQENYIPGVGTTSVKPTDKDRDALSSAKQIKDAITELQARAAKGGTTLPGTEADKVNKTKIAALQLQMKNLFQLGVLSSSDMEMLDKLVADPGSIFTSRSIKQLDATKKNMEALESNVAKKVGLKAFSSDKVKVSNGKQTFEIPKADLAAATKDGYRQVQ